MTRAQARRQGKARRRHLKFGDKVGELMEVEASYAVAIGPSEAANDTHVEALRWRGDKRSRSKRRHSAEPDGHADGGASTLSASASRARLTCTFMDLRALMMSVTATRPTCLTSSCSNARLKDSARERASFWAWSICAALGTRGATGRIGGGTCSGRVVT
eukprot:scaffold71316_cov25-Tisochrysis_lutea.AAC.5